jgi:hypothetical protein
VVSAWRLRIAVLEERQARQGGPWAPPLDQAIQHLNDGPTSRGPTSRGPTSRGPASRGPLDTRSRRSGRWGRMDSWCRLHRQERRTDERT